MISKTLKQIIGFPLTWMLFGIGHLCSKIDHIPVVTCIAGFLYQKTMAGSSIVQDWAVLGGNWVPWGEWCNPGDDDETDE